MKIIVDVMSENGRAEEAVKGSLSSLDSIVSDLVIVGDLELLSHLVPESYSERVRLIDAKGIAGKDDDPLDAIKRADESSLGVAIQTARDEGDALVSCGPLHALLTASAAFLKDSLPGRLPGIATILDIGKPVMLIDFSMSAPERPEMYLIHSLLGENFMRKVMNVQKPSLSVLVTPSAPESEISLVREISEKLSEEGSLSYGGTLSVSDLFAFPSDIVLCPNLSGSYIRELLPVVSSFFTGRMKETFESDIRSKIAFAIGREKITGLARGAGLDYGYGDIILGSSRPVIRIKDNFKSSNIRKSIILAEKYALSGIFASARE